VTTIGAAALAARRGWVREAEEPTGQCDVGGPVGVGEEAVVTDAVEPVGQDMDQEAADELVACQTRVDGIQLQAPFEALDDAFCSVGVSLDYYKHLNEIDPTQRAYILNALRDVVAQPELQPQFNAEEGWTVSLFRDTDPAEFLIEARAVLLENYSYLAELTSTLRFHAAGWADPLALDFQAPEPEWYFGGYRRIGPSQTPVLLPRRIIVLIGRNGSGKSTLLSRIARVAYASPADRARSETATIGVFDPPSIGFLKIVAVSYSAFDSFVVPGVFEGELRRLASDVQAGGGRYVFAGLRDIAAEARDVVNAYETAPPADPNNPQRIASDRRQTTHLKTLDQIADEFVRLVDQIRSSKHERAYRRDAHRIRRGAGVGGKPVPRYTGAGRARKVAPQRLEGGFATRFVGASRLLRWWLPGGLSAPCKWWRTLAIRDKDIVSFGLQPAPALRTPPERLRHSSWLPRRRRCRRPYRRDRHPRRHRRMGGRPVQRRRAG
jgi:energy-coupling factor transporter ATP-binding protein EcfA2